MSAPKGTSHAAVLAAIHSSSPFTETFLGAVIGSHRAMQQAGLPLPGEGFRSVIVCETPQDASVASAIWASWDGAQDPGAEWARRQPPRRGRRAPAIGAMERFVQRSGPPAVAGATSRALPQSLQPGPGGSGVGHPSRVLAAAERKAAWAPAPAGTTPTLPGREPSAVVPRLAGPARSPSLSSAAPPRTNALAELMRSAREKQRRLSSERGVQAEITVVSAKPRPPAGQGTSQGSASVAKAPESGPYAFPVPVNSFIGTQFPKVALNPLLCVETVILSVL